MWAWIKFPFMRQLQKEMSLNLKMPVSNLYLNLSGSEYIQILMPNNFL
jgi:hypothetical protein